MRNPLSDSVRFLKGVGPKRAKFFAQAGIRDIESLLYYFPRRYEDRRNFSEITSLREGPAQTIKARVLSSGLRGSWQKRNFKIFEIIAEDNSGAIACVWFNQPYLKNYLLPGTELVLYGRVQRYGSRLQMNSPEFEIIEKKGDDSLNAGRIVPVYSLPEKIGPRVFRRLIKDALDKYLPKINDFLSFEIRSKNSLINLAKSLKNIHLPDDFIQQKQAYQRLSFDEFFLFQVPLALRKLKRKEKAGIAHRVEGALFDSFINSLPFQLTGAQQKVIDEIRLDMAKPVPMQRLLQGDVGSGKTVVATAAGMMAIQGGYQVGFMVPTEVLAKQHYEKIKKQIANIKNQGKEIRIGLIAGSLNKAEKERVYQEIKSGRIDLIIGTHALLEGGVQFHKLGLVIIDEQHKFGVGQRALLPQKGVNPDILIMTATPIPRTLAITLYGDLDISVIGQLPIGRQAVRTTQVFPKHRKDAYLAAKKQLELGHQVYIVYPVIEESYALDLVGAEKMYARLKNADFKDYRLGLIHGRLKQEEQDKIMLDFKNKAVDILVSTTILEVGIDIPGATCMIIENAERFGLATLHQLRGRVGRSVFESFCFLVTDAAVPQAESRIRAMLKFNDGFRIAEEDLKIRGPGEFFGSRQHGLNELKIANPLTQLRLLKKAKEEAVKVVAVDPKLELRQNIALREKLLQRFPEYEKLAVIG